MGQYSTPVILQPVWFDYCLVGRSYLEMMKPSVCFVALLLIMVLGRSSSSPTSITTPATGVTFSATENIDLVAFLGILGIEIFDLGGRQYANMPIPGPNNCPRNCWWNSRRGGCVYSRGFGRGRCS